MTPPVVTDTEQFTDRDSPIPQKSRIFWVYDAMGQPSPLYAKMSSSHYELVLITQDLKGIEQCVQACPSVVVVDGSQNLNSATLWCQQLQQYFSSPTPLILLGVTSDWQVTELLSQGLPVGIQEVVSFSSDAYLRQRILRSLQYASWHTQRQQLSEQVKDLERLNHLKDEFIGTVVHELRTPITNMKVAGQLVEAQIQRVQQAIGEEIQSDSFGKALIYLQTLKRECERETVLINNLLDLQSLESGAYTFDYRAIEIEPWINQLVEPFLHRVQTRQLTLEVRIAQSLPPIISSEISLDRVLNELLHNACKYTPPGETIQLKAVLCDAKTLELSVKNTGVEIPKDQQLHVFEKFYRVPSSDQWKQGGTGLGLALVKRLLTFLGGTIQLKSGAGETQFILYLPLDQSSSSTITAELTP